jgi:3-methyladenine DNA glycosylase AlkD
VKEALDLLNSKATRRDRENLARFGISASNALGVSMANIQAIGKRLERSHELATALWDTGVYEARMLTAFVDEPARVTAVQMDRWRRGFDNWAICDTLCFHLFDRTPHAWGKVERWSKDRDEFGKRASFALLACLGAHDKAAPDQSFLDSFPIIESGAIDDRNFVKKAVSWALRAIGHRNPTLHAEALKLAQRLADSEAASARWVGRDAFRYLARRMPKQSTAT